MIEKERRTPPWQFKRLATHVLVTANALNRSRSQQKARTYFCKEEAGVCRTTILECVGIAGKRDGFRLAGENRGCKISGNAI
ncbi:MULTISPECIES: DUF5086 family protein [Rhizobium]|uniref:DUF5086 family protein n=1 Tax=Rhizobium TaxID=379 RepID=UPI000AE3D951|nr:MULTISPECIES: DUF5086 family protein [Rhizobium]